VRPFVGNRTSGPVVYPSVTEGVKMKKLTITLSAATALAAATIGLAAPASATPAPFPTDCFVHVIYQGNPVDVNWC
jgi:hypothetical protein